MTLSKEDILVWLFLCAVWELIRYFLQKLYISMKSGYVKSFYSTSTVMSSLRLSFSSLMKESFNPAFFDPPILE